MYLCVNSMQTFEHLALISRIICDEYELRHGLLRYDTIIMKI